MSASLRDPATSTLRSEAATGHLAVVLRHHALAGAAVVVAFAVLAPPLAPAVPPVATLLGVVLVALVPASAWLVRARLRTESVRGWWAVRQRLGLVVPSRRDVVRVGLPALAGSLLLPGAVVWLEPWWTRVTGIPDGWSTGWPRAGTLDPTATWALAGLWLVAAVVVGPVAEEVRFRGLLQPLTGRTPRGRVVLGSALFAGYHL